MYTASEDLRRDRAPASLEEISGASNVASTCPSFTFDPTSTNTSLTKLASRAYKSTCWKEMSSPGIESVETSLSLPTFTVSTAAVAAVCTASSLAVPFDEEQLLTPTVNSAHTLMTANE